MDLIVIIKEMVVAFAPFLQVGAAAAVPMAIGVAPRVGPGRAIVLAVRSLFRGENPISQRLTDVEYLRRQLFKAPPFAKESFIVVRGPKGAGKTCAINTATRYSLGVTHPITVRHNRSSDTIVEQACRQVTRMSSSFFADNMNSARRVAFWHRLIFRRPPVVVLRAEERRDGDKPAELGQAARRLSDLGLRVCIDCSNNAYDSKNLTKREEFYEMDWMSDEIIKQITEYGYIKAHVKKPETFQVFLAVCGGSPLHLLDLHKQVREAERKGRGDLEVVVESFVCNRMADALKKRLYMITYHPNMIKVLNEFKSKNAIFLKDAITVHGGPLPDLKGVLREKIHYIPNSGKTFVELVPADHAMAVLLRSEIVEASFSEIQSAVLGLKHE